MSKAEFLIIGGGYAAANTAINLRKLGAQGKVLMVSAEREHPYLRYTLSKEFLRGARQRERVFIRKPEFYQGQDIEVRLDTKVTGLDLGRRAAILEGGEEVQFDKLLLATGASPKRLPLPGGDLPGVHYLRSLADSEALKGEMEEGKRAVIIGGGFIGVELASSFTEKGLKVTVVDVAQTLWSHLFGEKIGRYFHDTLLERGVEVLAPAHVKAIEGDGRARRVVTAESRTLECDLVVVGVGVRPETGLAEAAGLKVDNGIVVNERLETEREGVYAAGDVARFFNPLFGTRMRVEHWDVAGGQGQVVARNMLGQGVAYAEPPYFFSDIFDLSLEFVGYAPRWDAVTVRRFDGKRFAAFFTNGGQVDGALLVNDTEELAAARQMVRARRPLRDLRSLEDASSALAQAGA